MRGEGEADMRLLLASDGELSATVAQAIKHAWGLSVVCVGANLCKETARLAWFEAVRLVEAMLQPPFVATLAVIPAAVFLWEGEGPVFGLARKVVKGSIGLVSLYRLRQGAVSAEKLALRAAKVAVHEVGHMLGLGHCRVKRCAMELATSLKALDSRSLRPCEDCEKRRANP